MSLLETSKTQANILKHKDQVRKDLNSALSTLASTIAEAKKLTAYLHEEAGVGTLVDNQDSNKFLNFLGRKSTAIDLLGVDLLALKDLKGINNAATGVNMGVFKASTGYIHGDYKVNFESE